MRSRLALVGATMVVGLAGCVGGDDEDADAAGSSSDGAAKTTEAKAADPATVLSCLKGEGVDAADQSNSTGEKIGIDGAGGRVIIYFEKSAEDAKTTASAAESTGETAVVKGSVAITLPSGTDVDQSTLEGCVESPG